MSLSLQMPSMIAAIFHFLRQSLAICLFFLQLKHLSFFIKRAYFCFELQAIGVKFPVIELKRREKKILPRLLVIGM